MREQLEQQLTEAEAVHAAAAKHYHKALAARNAADTKVRDACDNASEAANMVAALRAALKALPAPPKPKKLEAVN